MKLQKSRTVDQMIGADISFLPELESEWIKFSDKGVTKDAIEIIKGHGINYVRLRIFYDPAQDSGYSPKIGFCELAYTKQMAKLAKGVGLKLLLGLVCRYNKDVILVEYSELKGDMCRI